MRSTKCPTTIQDCVYLLATMGLAALAGCAPQSHQRVGLGVGPIIAIRYEWEPFVRGDTSRLQASVHADYERIRELGFDAIWPDYVACAEASEAAGLASSSDLALLAPCVPGGGQVVWNDADGDFSDVQGLVSRDTSLGGAVVIDTSSAGAQPIDVALRMDYAEGLAAGLNQGVLVWRYRSWPGEANGIAADDGEMNPRTAMAVKSLIRRVREWGPLLRHATFVPDASIEVRSESLRAAFYASRSGGIVIVRNVDAAHVSRGTVSIPSSLVGRSMTRVVERGSGQRHTLRGGTITVPVRLGPGDAALFEAH